MRAIISSDWDFNANGAAKNNRRHIAQKNIRHSRKLYKMVISVIVIEVGAEVKTLLKDETLNIDNTPQSFNAFWRNKVMPLARERFHDQWRFVPKANRVGFGYIENAERTQKIELKREDKSE